MLGHLCVGTTIKRRLWFHRPFVTLPRNLIGYPGAWFADLLLQGFGIGAFVFPIFLFGLAWKWVRSSDLVADQSWTPGLRNNGTAISGENDLAGSGWSRCPGVYGLDSCRWSSCPMSRLVRMAGSPASCRRLRSSASSTSMTPIGT